MKYNCARQSPAAVQRLFICDDVDSPRTGHLSDEMDKEVLEIVVKRMARDSNISRIIDVEAVPALGKGENYMSTIMRIKLKVVLGNGRVAKRSIIVKKANSGSGLDKMMSRFNPFKLEARMYSKVFQEMEYLMEEFQDHTDLLWCKYIHYDPQNMILALQDLKSIGCRQIDRQSGMDLEHGLLVLRSLAHYHAMGKVLEDRGIITKDDFDPHIFLSDSYYIQNMTYVGIQCLSRAMKEHWGPKWASVAEKLDNTKSDIFLEKAKHSGKYSDDEFTCLNHGDCWSNNIMFKYDWQDRPVSLKFVDYQLSHYNSPFVDVTQFLYVGLHPKVRRENYQHLLECYLNSLSENLERYGYTGPRPDPDKIEDIMNRISFFGLSMFICWYPALTAKTSNTFDMETLLQTDGKEGFCLDMYWEDGVIEKIEADLLEFVEKHLS